MPIILSISKLSEEKKVQHNILHSGSVCWNPTRSNLSITFLFICNLSYRYVAVSEFLYQHLHLFNHRPRQQRALNVYENLFWHTGITFFSNLINKSINQTLKRSINQTSIGLAIRQVPERHDVQGGHEDEHVKVCDGVKELGRPELGDVAGKRVEVLHNIDRKS